MVHGKVCFTHCAFSSPVPINESRKFAAWLSPIIVLKTTQPETPLSLLWFTKMVLGFITFSCLLDLQLQGSGQAIKDSQCLGKGGLSLVRSHCDVRSSNHTGGGMCSFCQAPSADKVWGQKQQELWHRQRGWWRTTHCGCDLELELLVVARTSVTIWSQGTCTDLVLLIMPVLLKLETSQNKERDLGLTSTLKLSLCLWSYYNSG